MRRATTALILLSLLSLIGMCAWAATSPTPYIENQLARLVNRVEANYPDWECTSEAHGNDINQSNIVGSIECHRR